MSGGIISDDYLIIKADTIFKRCIMKIFLAMERKCTEGLEQLCKLSKLVKVLPRKFGTSRIHRLN